jgi:hypothetical protein
MCVNIEHQILRTRMAVERTEYMLARTEGVLAGWRRDVPVSIPSAQPRADIEAASPTQAIRRDPPAPWMPRVAVPALALVITVAIASLISVLLDFVSYLIRRLVARARRAGGETQECEWGRPRLREATRWRP